MEHRLIRADKGRAGELIQDQAGRLRRRVRVQSIWAAKGLSPPVLQIGRELNHIIGIGRETPLDCQGQAIFCCTGTEIHCRAHGDQIVKIASGERRAKIK